MYRVVAYVTKDHSVDDDTLIEDYGEAAELACEWQQYYDDLFDDGFDEVIVCIEDFEGGLVDGSKNEKA